MPMQLPFTARLGDLRLEIIAFWTMFSLTLLSLYFPLLRYVGYLVPFVALLLALADGKLKIKEIAKPYLFLILIGLVLFPLANSAGFKDLFFLFSGISASLVISRMVVLPRIYLVLFAAGTIVFWAQTGGFAKGLAFDFANSQSSFEGNFGFLFGLLAVYAAVKRQNWIFVLAFIGAVLALKRIVLLSVLVCWVVSLLPEKITRKLLNPIILLTANLAIIIVLVLYANHQFDYLIGLITGQSANQLGQGRQQLYATVARSIFANPFGHILFGAGPGAAYDSLGRMFGAFGTSNLHSDLLKIFFEYGLIAFSAFIWLGYRMRDLRIRIMFLYVNILYATDNVLIYHFFLFFLCLFASSLEDESALQIQDNETAPKENQYAPAIP